MGSYTKIDQNKAQEILSLYDLGKVQQLTPLSLGISNSNYRLQTQSGVYLFKISNDKNYDQLAQEQRLLLYLHEKKYPYSLCPIALKDKSHIYHYEDYFGVIYPFIEGIPPGPGDQTCRAIGEALAKLHLIELPPADYIRPHEEVGFGVEQMAKYCMTSTCPEDFKVAFETICPDRGESFKNSQFERRIIHGDLYYDNTLFDHNHLAAVLDFEQGGIGEAILDLGISISGTCLEKGFVSFGLVESFLRGYESIRPLSKMEKQILNQVICLGLLSISLWRIKRFKEGDLDPTMMNSYQELVNKALIHFHKTKALI